MSLVQLYIFNGRVSNYAKQEVDYKWKIRPSRPLWRKSNVSSVIIKDFMAGYRITQNRKLILNERLGRYNRSGENPASLARLLTILWQGIELH